MKRTATTLGIAALAVVFSSGCEATDPFTGRMAGADQIQFELDNFLQSTGGQIDKLNVDIANKKRLVASLESQLADQETQANGFIGGIEKMLGQAPSSTDGGLAAGLGLTAVALQQDNRRKDRKIGNAQDDLDDSAKKARDDAGKVTKPRKTDFRRRKGTGKPAGNTTKGSGSSAPTTEQPAAVAVPAVTA